MFVSLYILLISGPVVHISTNRLFCIKAPFALTNSMSLVNLNHNQTNAIMKEDLQIPKEVQAFQYFLILLMIILLGIIAK
jgi:hypothetical protein